MGRERRKRIKGERMWKRREWERRGKEKRKKNGRSCRVVSVILMPCKRYPITGERLSGGPAGLHVAGRE